MVVDLLKMRKIRTQTQLYHLHNDQHNLPKAVQISVWFKTCFWGL